MTAMSNAYSSKSRPTSLKQGIQANITINTDRSERIMSPRRALEMAKQEKLTVTNRVRYLANEQVKYQKKILKAREDVDRKNKIKASKIDEIKMKIVS